MQRLANVFLPGPPVPTTGEPVAGNEYIVLDALLADGILPIVWEDTSWLAVENAVLTLTTPPNAGISKSWGWGAGLQYLGQMGQNLTGFENGTLQFDLKGTVNSTVQIGFQTGIFGSASRPQTNNYAEFGAGGIAITGDWVTHNIAIRDIALGSADFTDVSSPIYFYGASEDGGVLEVRNIRYLK